MIYVWSNTRGGAARFIETDMSRAEAGAILGALVEDVGIGDGIMAVAEAIDWRRDDTVRIETFAWTGDDDASGLSEVAHGDGFDVAWAQVPPALLERVLGFVERELDDRAGANAARKVIADARVAGERRVPRVEIIYGAEHDAPADDMDQRIGGGE